MSDGALVLLDPDNAEHLRAVAGLHARLLPQSPIPRLGGAFMRRFFYSSLVKDGLVRCYLYRTGGRYVGFLSLTEKPFSFMSDGRRAHTLQLSALLAHAVLTRPSRLGILLDVLRAGQRSSPPDAQSIGECLSFGVLEEFAAVRDEARGLRIPNVLFDEGIAHFRSRGFRRVEWNVDSRNLRAVLFYRSYGATLERSPLAWPSDYRVRLDLAAQRSAS